MMLVFDALNSTYHIPLCVFGGELLVWPQWETAQLEDPRGILKIGDGLDKVSHDACSGRSTS